MSIAPGFDYVVVGAGSAGCVLAARLSEDPTCRVLLVEAGGRGRSPFAVMPAGLSRLVPGPSSCNWALWTEPQPELRGRRLYWPRGKGLGGSTLINGMIYVRGHPRDYDEWQALGLRDWSYSKVLPDFIRAESNSRGAGDYHGDSGPLRVSEPLYRQELDERFISAAVEAGLPHNRDFNGAVQSGAGAFQLTLDGRRRCSAAAAYLAPAAKRPNLEIRTGTRVARVLIDRNTARGVVAMGRRGHETIRAERAVVLAAGAVHTPQLLMLSGIGPAEHLRAHGMPVRADLPGVGANLQDHLDVAVRYRCAKPSLTLNPVLASRGRMLLAGLRYYLGLGGPAAAVPSSAGAFIETRWADGRPDLQVHFVPMVSTGHGMHGANVAGYSLRVCQLRPASRGRIRLRSADPGEQPRIDPRYLSVNEDIRILREGVRACRRIAAAPSLAGVSSGELSPGDDFVTNHALDERIRLTAETVYHPVGTCAMGTDGNAVVDTCLRVRGIDALRVVDASVMPLIPGGNTNAPTIMIAEKAAAMMLNESRGAADVTSPTTPRPSAPVVSRGRA